MAQRTEAQDPLSVFSRPTLAPAASPVDVYVKPTLAPSKGEQLGIALESLDALRPGLNREVKRRADVELAAGEALFEKNREPFAEAVRSGKLPFGASPYARRGYRISQLRTLSSSYTVELNRAMESSNIHEEDDPAKVEAFIKEFTTQFEETNGVNKLPAREVDRHYRPVTVRAQEGFRQEQATRNIALMEERRVRAFEQELFAALETSRGGDISGWINAAAEELYSEGIDHSVIERSIMGALGTYAVERGSVAPINMLGSIEVAGMGPLNSSVAGREAATNLREHVGAKAQRAAGAAAAADERARKAEALGIERGIAAAYIAGDTAEAERLASTLVEYDPDAAYTWANRADSRADETETERQDDNASTLLGVAIESGDPEFANQITREAMILGDISVSHYSSLQGIIGNVYPDPKDAKPVPSVLEALSKDPNYSDVTSNLGRLVSNEDSFGMAEAGARDAADRAKRGVQRDAIAWMQTNRAEDGSYDQIAFQDYIWGRSDFYRDRWIDPSNFTDNNSRETAINGGQRYIQDPGVPMPPSATAP